MNNTTRISFVRHGLVHNPDGIIYGRLPRFRLSPEGIQDAKRAASVLKNEPMAALFSSPLLRTRQTAREILAFHPTLKRKTSSLLIEVLVPFQGQPEKNLAPFSYDVYCRPSPGYEQPDDILARGLKFIKKVRKAYAGKHVAAVTHGDVILFLTLWAAGYEASARNKLNIPRLKRVREYPATGSVTTLAFGPGDALPSLVYVNPKNV